MTAEQPAASAPSPDPLLALVAGETSGDLLAGLLLQGLRRRWPDLRAVGIGGPQMAQLGFHAWWPHTKLAVHGFSWELLWRLREILGIRKALQARLLAQPPQLFIGVDAPDFNLELECRLRAQGVKTVHFVCPSIWAWRPERVEKIRRAADHVLCIFPFEPALLAEHGIAATYVGHPLAQLIPLQADRAAARAALGLRAEDLVLAVLPGSRSAEIRYLAECFLRAAQRVQEAHPALKVLVPAVPALRAAICAAAQRCGMAERVQIVDGQSHTVLAACDLTLVASGTATLEAALFKRPMVIGYRVGALNWQLMKRKQLQPWVGLPNILCQAFVVPELIQERATPEALAEALLQWLDDAAHRPEVLRGLEQRFSELHALLRRDTATLATDAIQTLLAR